MLLTLDPEYVNDFLIFHWEHRETAPNFKIVKTTVLGILPHFFYFQRSPGSEEQKTSTKVIIRSLAICICNILHQKNGIPLERQQNFETSYPKTP